MLVDRCCCLACRQCNCFSSPVDVLFVRADLELTWIVLPGSLPHYNAKFIKFHCFKLSVNVLHCHCPIVWSLALYCFFLSLGSIVQRLKALIQALYTNTSVCALCTWYTNIVLDTVLARWDVVKYIIFCVLLQEYTQHFSIVYHWLVPPCWRHWLRPCTWNLHPGLTVLSAGCTIHSEWLKGTSAGILCFPVFPSFKVNYLL